MGSIEEVENVQTVLEVMTGFNRIAQCISNIMLMLAKLLIQ